MSAQLSDNELLITRTFDAPAELVFSMWSDPEHFKNWMGPETFDCPVVEMDFRVGGAYRAMIRSDEHGENWFGGIYQEIERYTRLVFMVLIDLFYADEEWAKLRRPGAVEFMNKRVNAVSKALGDKPFLDGDNFTAGDLMMSTVLRGFPADEKLDPSLKAYINRCTSRPAFKRALDAQLCDFRDAA